MLEGLATRSAVRFCASSAPSWPNKTTSGLPSRAATSPRDPLARSTQRRQPVRRSARPKSIELSPTTETIDRGGTGRAPLRPPSRRPPHRLHDAGGRRSGRGPCRAAQRGWPGGPDLVRLRLRLAAILAGRRVGRALGPHGTARAGRTVRRADRRLRRPAVTHLKPPGHPAGRCSLSPRSAV